jgi:hypothetical protein
MEGKTLICGIKPVKTVLYVGKNCVDPWFCKRTVIKQELWNAFNTEKHEGVVVEALIGEKARFSPLKLGILLFNDCSVQYLGLSTRVQTCSVHLAFQSPCFYGFQEQYNESQASQIFSSCSKRM